MMIRSRTACILWRAALLLFGLFGLLDGAGILTGSYHSNFPHMFTNISNLAAWVYFLCAMIRLIIRKEPEIGVPFLPVFKYTVTISLLVTMLIAHFMLFNAMFKDGHLVWCLVILHYVAPCMTLLDWLLFDQKGKMPVWGPFAWISLGVAYLAFTMIYVGVFGRYMGGGTTADLTSYPYDFLDPAIKGTGAVIGFCGAMIIAFIVLGYVLYGIDHLMRRK
jgi:hypothetical protein